MNPSHSDRLVARETGSPDEPWQTARFNPRGSLGVRREGDRTAHVMLTDRDLDARLPMPEAIRTIESALRAHAEGRLLAPPRFSVAGERGALVFTVGGTKGARAMLGFRAYTTFGGGSPDHVQLVAVFDGVSGDLEGVVLGNRLGALRTGAIGGVAIDRLAIRDARRLAILGSGTQARTQLEAAVCVRPFETVRVFSPHRAHREAFARELSAVTGRTVEAVRGPRDAVEEADVVVCATTSGSPAFRSDWLKPGAHVTTLGGAFRGAADIEPRVVQRSTVIVTDSRAQLEAFTDPSLVVGTAHEKKLVELGALVVGRARGRVSDKDITLFLSVGLAGTEVAVADAALRPR